MVTATALALSLLASSDGRVLALDPASGEKVWEFASGDSVLAAPAVEAGRLFFGSFVTGLDGRVYGFEQ